MIRFVPLFLAAALIVGGVALLSIPAGLMVAGVAVLLLWFVLREVPDASD